MAAACQATQPFGKAKALYSIGDIQLRGLLFGLREDPRLQAFVDRTLGPLLLRDATDQGDLVRTLSAYLRFQRNKSLTALELGISRPTLYERLARVQRLLGMDLDDSEASASLYAAIMVIEATAPTSHSGDGASSRSCAVPRSTPLIS